MNRPKLCGNCAFPQSFHTRKSSEITVFFAVVVNDEVPSTFPQIVEQIKAIQEGVLQEISKLTQY